VSTDENTTEPAAEPTAEVGSEAVEITESGEVVGKSSDDSPDDAGESTEKDSGEKSVRRTDRGMLRRNVGAILVAVALVASAGVASWLYFYQYRVDQQTNADASNVALGPPRMALSRYCRTRRTQSIRTSRPPSRT
jgi:Mce-associated membrane protein